MLKIRLLVTLTLAALIVGCSSAPRTVTSTIPSTSNIVQEQIPDKTPEYYIEQAERAYSRSGDISLRNQYLLKSAEAFKLQQACLQSKKIIHLIEPELTDNIQITQANLILAECELDEETPDYSTLTLLTNEMSMQIGYDKRINLVAAKLFENDKKWKQAALATLSSNLDEREASQRAWKLLQNLGTDELSALARSQPILAPWSQLALLGRDYGLLPERLAVEVENWKNQFAGHPLAVDFPAEIQLASSLPLLSAPKIAVLLPFTGRLANQGQAVKQGILAAYFDKQTSTDSTPANAPHIQFFDSALHSSETLLNMTEEFDLIIGPLLKDKLSEMLTLLPSQKTVLGLNRIDQNSTPNDGESRQMQNRFYFALAPEDEAIQLARKVKQEGLENLIVVADDANATRRMADAFIQEWRSLSDDRVKPPTLAIFSDNKTLTSSLTSSLDVAQSKSRIKQIEKLVTQELHAVPRNRRDVDAIVIFANADQTELINPLIEASLSPFGNKTVPVFASSRSYSLNLSNNSMRDLRNLKFTDMPWMLPDNKWTSLTEQTNRLWPQQNDQLRRLFALGYDSYTVIPWLRHLHIMPVLSKTGLTGELSVLKDGSVVRNLPYGHIIDDKVTVIAMD